MNGSVLNLDLGAGPGQSMGGLSLMRRPAQTPFGPTARTAWAHPYHGVTALGVFYNDGGNGPQTPPAPSPADLAARAGQQPAPAAPGDQAPLTQRITPDNSDVLIDKDTGQPMTQGRLSQLMTKQFEKSRRSAFREMAEAAGVPFDPDNFDPETFGKLLKDAQEARQQALTDEQRRVEDLEKREQAIKTREEKAAQREKEAADRDRATRIRSALVSLGATGADLDDAAALLRVADDASDEDIAKAAEELKGRRKEMFGGLAEPQTLPPAPSGGPAGGNAPRQPSGGKDAVNERARQMAIERGLRAPDAA